MHRGRRTNRLAKWAGVGLCVLIAAAFVASARWQIAFQFPTSRGPTIYFVAGSALIVTDEMLTVPVSADGHSYGLSRWNSWVAGRFRLPSAARPAFYFYLEFPLYALLLAVAIPTSLVWRFRRKPVKPGHCRCGYDLTGNMSGACPECGKRV